MAYRSRPDDHRGLDGRDVPPLSRRGLLGAGLSAAGLGLTAAALAACGPDQGPTIQPLNEGANADNALLAVFPQQVPHVPPGIPFRLPYLITGAEGIPLSKIPGPVTFSVKNVDGQKVGDPVQVAPRSDGVPRAYLPFTFTFPNVGIYYVTAEYNGAALESAVQVYGRDRVTSPVTGDQLPPVATSTISQSLEVNPICTAVPLCPFHSVNLTDALGQGKPVVVLLSTPAYCQTAVCGPVLELLEEQAAFRTDITVIHSEVYKNPKDYADNLKKAPLAPLPEEYDMRFEPSLFVTNAAGVLQARADSIVDRSEMVELLALAR